MRALMTRGGSDGLLIRLVFVCVFALVPGFRHGGVPRAHSSRRRQRAESPRPPSRHPHPDSGSDAAAAALQTAGGQHVPQPGQPRPHFRRAGAQVSAPETVHPDSSRVTKDKMFVITGFIR